MMQQTIPILLCLVPTLLGKNSFGNAGESGLEFGNAGKTGLNGDPDLNELDLADLDINSSGRSFW